MKRKLTMSGILIAILVLLFSLVGCSDGDEIKPVRFYFYYSSPCGSCDVGGEFEKQAEEILSGINETHSYEIVTVNVFQNPNADSLQTFKKENKISDKDINYPIFASSHDYLNGQSEIDENLLAFVTEETTAKTGRSFAKDSKNNSDNIPNAANDDNINSSPIDENASYFVYFSTSSCEDCLKTKTFFDTLGSNFSIHSDGTVIESNLQIDSYNITDGDSLKRLESFFNQYNVPKKERQVPIVFYKSGYLSGNSAIEESMLNVISDGKALGFSELTVQEKSEVSFTWKQLPGIFVTGLINGFNPCSISMLLLFMSLLVAKKKSVLKLGISFIFGKMTAYFLFGIISYQMLQLVNSAVFKRAQIAINIILILLSFVLAAMNLIDAYWAKKEQYNHIKMQLPRGIRQWTHGLINSCCAMFDSKWAVIFMMGLGVIISAGEFLCTGQIYVATIIYLVQNTGAINALGVMSFILYVTGIALPLIVAVLLIYKGKSTLSTSELVRRHMPLIKIVYAIVFLSFGAFLLAGIL